MNNKSDFEKARKIVAKRERWIGPHGVLQDNIANAVAEGIALGRKEGFALAAEAIQNLINAPDQQLPADRPARIRVAMHKLLGVLLLCCCVFLTACNQTTSQSVPPPTLSLSDQQMFDKARAALFAQLKDPDSAKLSDLKRVPANGVEYVCGRVNARNGFGGYSGGNAFSVRVDNGEALIAGESVSLGVWTSPCWNELHATQGDVDRALRSFAGQNDRNPNSRISQ